MTETEELELLSDYVDVVLQSLKGRKVTALNKEKVIRRIEEQRPSMNAIGLCGLPGAGKSYIADELADKYDTEVISMGDAIREEYRERHGESHGGSEELANFAAEWRDEAPEEIPQKVVEIASSVDEDLVIIDGVRSLTDYNVLDENFGEFYLIKVQASFYTRLSRLNERGREGEDEFDAVDLAKRDKNERENLGYGELVEEEKYDVNMDNEGEGLEYRLPNIVLHNIPFEAEEDAFEEGIKRADSIMK